MRFHTEMSMALHEVFLCHTFLLGLRRHWCKSIELGTRLILRLHNLLGMRICESIWLGWRLTGERTAVCLFCYCSIHSKNTSCMIPHGIWLRLYIGLSSLGESSQRGIVGTCNMDSLFSVSCNPELKTYLHIVFIGACLRFIKPRLFRIYDISDHPLHMHYARWSQKHIAKVFCSINHLRLQMILHSRVQAWWSWRHWCGNIAQMRKCDLWMILKLTWTPNCQSTKRSFSVTMGCYNCFHEIMLPWNSPLPPNEWFFVNCHDMACTELARHTLYQAWNVQ